MPKDDKSGYGKPPKQHQWKKGQSGNPKGRKRRTTDPTTLIGQELQKVISLATPQGEIRMTKLQAFVTSIINDAIKGDSAARRLLLGILNVSAPPASFEPTTDDEAAFRAFIGKQLKKLR